MLSIDLKAIGGMESHRGIGYMLLITAIFPPSFLSLAFLRPDLVEGHLLLAVLMASSVGLLSTACITAALFISIVDPDEARRMKWVGARALGVGAALSLMGQTIILGIQVAGSGITTFRAYAVGVGSFLIIQCASIFIRSMIEGRRSVTAVRSATGSGVLNSTGGSRVEEPHQPRPLSADERSSEK